MPSFGFGYGFGFGSGFGDGYGFGDGFGSGFGYGCGYCEGYGFGYSFGPGYGCGCGKKIGDACGHKIVLLKPWPCIKVGCQVLGIDAWAEEWQKIAADHSVKISAEEVERIIAKAREILGQGRRED